MNNIFICAYKRTPIGAFQGSLSKIDATELGAIVITVSYTHLTLPTTPYV